jgi:hypothetical protein
MRVRGFIGTLQIVFVFVCLLVLGVVLVANWSTPMDNCEPNIGLGWLMSALTFPFGPATISFLGNHTQFLLSMCANRMLYALEAWVLMFAMGWLQWFVVIGWSISRVSRWYRARQFSA